MQLDMIVEGRFPSKGFAALSSTKCLFPGVDPDVIL